MHFNHFAVILAAVVTCVTLGVSRWYPAPDESQLAGRTIWSKRGQSQESYGDLDAQQKSSSTAVTHDRWHPGQCGEKSQANMAMGDPPATTLGRTEDIGNGLSPTGVASRTKTSEAVAHDNIQVDINIGPNGKGEVPEGQDVE